MKTNDLTLTADNVSPIEDLRQILSGAGEDVAKIFGSAISIYAGPFAAGKLPEEKYSSLERLITEYKASTGMI
jgi:hypothetical protein